MTTFPLESFLDDLKFLINTDSGSADIEGNLQVASFFKERFEKAGLETVLHRVGTLRRPVVIAKTPGSASYDYFFSGHIDTVFLPARFPKGRSAARAISFTARERSI